MDPKLAALRATCALLIPADLPDWVQLMPLGKIDARDGRNWTLKDPAAVIAASMSLGMDLPIDLDHAMEFAPKGTPTPAAGWIKKMEARADGIWGQVSWTAKGAEAVKSGEYRYLSPVFYADKSGAVKLIQRAALTNDPALYLKAVASKETEMEEFLKQLAKALGLPDDAGKDKIVAAVTAKASAAAEATKAIAKALGLPDDAAPDKIAAAAAQLKQGAGAETVKAVAKAAGMPETASAEDVMKKIGELAASAKKDPDPTKFVAFADYEKVCTRLSALEQATGERDATERVEKAMREGKIAPAMKEWALSLAKSDPAKFDEYVKSAPQIVKPGADPNARKHAKAGDQLSDEEKAVCRRMGLKEEDFRKSRDEDLKAEENAA